MLGLDLSLNYVETLLSNGLVGTKFMNKVVKPVDEKWCMKVGMVKFLGYSSVLHVLYKGWVSI